MARSRKPRLWLLVGLAAALLVAPLAMAAADKPAPKAKPAKAAKQAPVDQQKKTQFLGGAHDHNGVSCTDCHGGAKPAVGDTVETAKCLECHGPMDKLVEKTKPAQHADRNPHQSHLGEIDCTVCHKAHEPSTVYCLGCHPKFEMKIKHDK